MVRLGGESRRMAGRMSANARILIAHVDTNHCIPTTPFSKFIWDTCEPIPKPKFPIFPNPTPQPCGLALRYRSAMGQQ